MNTNARLRWLLAAIVVMAAIVFARVVALELWYGDQYREVASRPIERRMLTGATRGRILAKDGTVLAYDREAAALAIHYRFLEQPSNETWLRREARRRLPRKERRDATRVAAECRRLVAEQALAHERLAKLCGLPPKQYRERLQAVQRRVERIAESVRARHERDQRSAQAPAADRRWWRRLLGWMEEDVRTGLLDHISVAEEYEYHPVFVGLTLEAVAEIEGSSQRYPGTRIVTWRQRVYPQGTLAAHLVGYVPDASTDLLLTGGAMPAGQQGVERQFDNRLQGTPGVAIEAADRSGRLVGRRIEREPEPGRDLHLTIDPSMQAAAEGLLDQAIERRLVRDGEGAPAGGGAIVVLDVATGAIDCSASAPRFAPETAARGDGNKLERLFNDPSKPLFDRTTQMALPPGSVFKPLTAIALVEEDIVEPARPFLCQGYLTVPEKERCLIFRQSQTGHGPIKLADALARSCNVYFYHHAGELGVERLAAWAAKFGFGSPTGIDLPDEATGNIVGQQAASLTPDDVRAMAIGQGMLTATPLQVVRLMAAIANGGRLVTPHVADVVATSTSAVKLGDRTLGAVRRGLEQVVADRQGTAYATVRLDALEIAGKTGSAENATGKGHAWFAGFVPAERPRYAFAVVIEYGGGGAETAGPIARRLVEKMHSLGYFSRRSRLASRLD
ncbi:MAG: peptidoglycan D,D-transpeptidase FtsI family protein [Pirellulales bacterium]